MEGGETEKWSRWWMSQGHLGKVSLFAQQTHGTQVGYNNQVTSAGSLKHKAFKQLWNVYCQAHTL